jgi:hypothetical protein
MITIIDPAEYPTIVDSRLQSQFVRHVFVALGDRTRVAICAMSELIHD